jgi:hypothetical protein
LRYVTNNQRFFVFEERRRPNLASKVLSLCLRRLSADFGACWGHRVVAVGTFSDPRRHLGICYAASSFDKIGETSGYGRKTGRFVRHGGTKVYWLRALRRDALFLLSAQFDHPLLSSRTTMSALDLNRLDLDSPVGLLARLEAVPDPRDPCGIRYRLAVILSIATLATFREAMSLVAVGDSVAVPAPGLLGRNFSPDAPYQGVGDRYYLFAHLSWLVLSRGDRGLARPPGGRLGCSGSHANRFVRRSFKRC